jgi:hypothetical protein
MLRRIMILAILFFVAFQIHADAQVPSELREAMQTRLEAVWKKDAQAWAGLTADEFTIVVPEGKLMNKTERITALKTEKAEALHAIQREQIQSYGDTVLHRFIDGSEWVLEVWVKQNGVWRVVAAQVNFAKQ